MSCAFFLQPHRGQIPISEKQKTVRRQVFEMENLPKMNSFLVRISDGKNFGDAVGFEILNS